MKLAQYQKDQIRSKVVAEKFDPLFEALEAEKQAFAQALVAPAQALIADLPAEWFGKSSSIKCYFNGYCEWIKFAAEDQPLPRFVNDKGYRFALESDEFKTWHALNARREELELRKEELRAEVAAVLKALSTDKKLEEVWPEAVKYLDRAPSLPATTDVNRLKMLLSQP